MTQATFSFEDFSRERSATTLWLQFATGLNYASIETDAGELQTALQGVTLGKLRRRDITSSDIVENDAVTDPNAQRERKWLVVYRDILEFLDPVNAIGNPGFGKLFTAEIPTADASLTVAGTDKADFSDPAIIAFKASFEANARSPYNQSNASGLPGPFIEVVDMVLVGRNL